MTMKLVVGETLSKIQGTIENDGSAVNLTGSSLTLKLKIGKSAEFATASPPTILIALSGTWEYQFVLGDVSEPGRMQARVTITSGSLKGRTYKFFVADVEAEAME